VTPPASDTTSYSFSFAVFLVVSLSSVSICFINMDFVKRARKSEAEEEGTAGENAAEMDVSLNPHFEKAWRRCILGMIFLPPPQAQADSQAP